MLHDNKAGKAKTGASVGLDYKKNDEYKKAQRLSKVL
jgi:hypothetical protein